MSQITVSESIDRSIKEIDEGTARIEERGKEVAQQVLRLRKLVFDNLNYPPPRTQLYDGLDFGKDSYPSLAATRNATRLIPASNTSQNSRKDNVTLKDEVVTVLASKTRSTSGVAHQETLVKEGQKLAAQQMEIPQMASPKQLHPAQVNDFGAQEPERDQFHEQEELGRLRAEGQSKAYRGEEFRKQEKQATQRAVAETEEERLLRKAEEERKTKERLRKILDSRDFRIMVKFKSSKAPASPTAGPASRVTVNADDSQVLTYTYDTGAGDKRTSHQETLRFSHIFEREVPNTDLWPCVVDMVDEVWTLGMSSSIICYGQSGSGKTVMMLGRSGPKPIDGEGGLVGRSIQHLLGKLKATEEVSDPRCLFLSAFEITLSPKTVVSDEILPKIVNDLIPSIELQKFQLPSLQSIQRTINVHGISLTTLKDHISTAKLLTEIDRSRKTGKTTNNKHSSRATLVIAIMIADEILNQSRTSSRLAKPSNVLLFADLPGSEESGASKFSRETAAINRIFADLQYAFGDRNKQMEESKLRGNLQMLPDKPSDNLTQIVSNNLVLMIVAKSLYEGRTAVICSIDEYDAVHTKRTMEFAKAVLGVNRRKGAM